MFPDGTYLIGDSAFQGYHPRGAEVIIPAKKPRGGQLTNNDKEFNKLISSFRVVIEHVISGVKRSRIVKDVFRNLRTGFRDVAMEIACGLHNLRSACRS